jgi:integral membrane protein (TIGR00529 family)
VERFNAPITYCSFFLENRSSISVALLDPLIALSFSFTLLALMLYKRVALGLALVSSATSLCLLSMSPVGVYYVFIHTTLNPLTVSLVSVTIGIMLLSLLYKETKALDTLSSGVGALLRNPKLTISVLPAVVGLLPVPGGALMSAPLVETEARKLGLDKTKKAYVNVWFRHVIFPLYPMSQVLILAAALTGASLTSIILSQIPVVATMIVIGYFIVLRKAQVIENNTSHSNLHEHVKDFLLSFSPILVMILAVAIFGLDVSIAAFVGVATLLTITKPSQQTLVKTATNISTYKIALAAYGAMLLRTATMESGVSEAIGQVLATSNINETLLLATLPAALAFFVGSPSGGIAISVPIIGGIMQFTATSASLLFISAYLGYLGSPTHLCLALTVDYFESAMSRVYKFLVPSLAVSFAVAVIVYYLL